MKKKILTTFETREKVKKKSYCICNQGGGGRALRNINSANKDRYEWYTKARIRLQYQVLKLCLLSLHSIINIPKATILL